MWKCRAVENDENQNQVSLVFHRPWKSLRDSHIPTTPTTILPFPNQNQKPERSPSYAESPNPRLQAHPSMRKCSASSIGLAKLGWDAFRLVFGFDSSREAECPPAPSWFPFLPTQPEKAAGLCDPCATRYQSLVRGIRVHVIQRFVILPTIPRDSIVKPALPNDGLSPLFVQALQHARCGNKSRGSGGQRTDSAKGKSEPARLDPRYALFTARGLTFGAASAALPAHPSRASKCHRAIETKPPAQSRKKLRRV